MLNLDRMRINRVVVHNIPARAPDKSYAAPEGGRELVRLDRAVSDVVVARISKALGSRSHGLQAEFSDTGLDSMFARTCQMMDCEDSEFLSHASEAAKRLATVQMAKPLEASKLITMSGVATSHERPFVAFVKAELEMALTETRQGNEHVLRVLKDLFMTESQRLYKIGYFSRSVAGTGKKDGRYAPDFHSIHLFDHLLTSTESRHAAIYFYGEFLGSDIAKSDRRLTQEFFEKTLAFISNQSYTPGKKIALGEAVRSELRSNDGTFSVSAFADKHMAVRDAVQYVANMTKKGFPDHAINKDIEFVRNRLRKRQKFYFTSGVVVSTPPDQARQLVRITPGEDGSTTVRIEGTLESSD